VAPPGPLHSVPALAVLLMCWSSVVGLAGPRLRLIPPLLLCDGGEFTATVVLDLVV
jgi:hypothetical protein